MQPCLMGGDLTYKIILETSMMIFMRDTAYPCYTDKTEGRILWK